ncbi:hypothetical protein SAMN04487969_102464 [Paenibacillus algorifonticola]|uniref:AAA domain-containing protein n=1 Tax=Paenibacillus algorifonticola TaxID=684063 RepID=A0A1I2AFK7_9BACL|nr:hypothetical protein [Paenibacillus algorifonticola]SFE42696.1 hypothetical protein SAMN04487969_102464 [Paenibacillus algorifonticola]
MAKVVRFIETEAVNYTGLRSKQVKYGNVTALSGRNGQGKTSIGTMPVWVLWGKDLLGSDYTSAKNSPRPSNYKYDRVYASLLLSVDGVEYKFAREIVGKTNSFYVNDVPKPAKEFEAAVAALFSQDEFMALYFPAYFFGLHWTKQRELLMKGVPAPLNKTVFIEMSRTSPEQAAKEIELNPQAAKLAELVKKHSINDLEAMHKDQRPKLDKAHTEAVGAAKKVREMLDRLPEAGDIVALEAEVASLRADIEREDKIVADAWAVNNLYNEFKYDWQQLDKQVKDSVAAWPALKDEPIQDTCRTCKQHLQNEAVEAVKADKERRILEYRAKHTALIKKRDNALELFKGAEQIDVSEQQAKVRSIEDKLDVVLTKLRESKERAKYEAEVAATEEAEASTLASLRETTFILDAIKAFRAKEAELQAAEIQSKFTRLSIRLFKFVASRGEYDPDFSVQMDGKDYISLSVGEKIEAGLELTEVLFKQSDLITPVFIDGIGEYTGPIAAYDQVITGRAVLNQDLQIEADGVIQ